MAQGGIECRRTTNFRSDGAILDVVNGAFEQLVQPQAGVQPPYIGIEPAPGRTSLSGGLRKSRSERSLPLTIRPTPKPPGGSKARAWRNG